MLRYLTHVQWTVIAFQYLDVISDNTEGRIPITGGLHNTFHAVTLANTAACGMAERKNTIPPACYDSVRWKSR